MDEGLLKAEIAKLKLANEQLTDQLDFSRQKASLYYIAKSELEILRRSRQEDVGGAVMMSVTTDTDDLASTHTVSAETGCQTESVADVLVAQMEKNLLESEIASLKAFSSLTERTERVRTQFMQRIEAVVTADQSTASSNPVLDSVVKGYSDLFEEYLRLNHLSVNHSLEIKKRDEMIGSLLDKIKMMEQNFSRRISHAERLADSRKAVIEELGEQVKVAMKFRHTSDTGKVELSDEIEDLRAELSMARSNWAATRDELFRLQFRVGVDGTGAQGNGQEYPPPLIALIDSQGQGSGIIGMIREIRDLSCRI
jgi:hypothetical protein